FLRVLDELNSMFEEIRSGIDPSAASSVLLEQLLNLQNGGSVIIQQSPTIQSPADVLIPEPVAETDSAGTAAPQTDAGKEFVAGDDNITDDEFEQLLDALQGSKPSVVDDELAAGKSAQSTSSKNDEITDDEFEALLDSLHGTSTAVKAVDEVEALEAGEKPAAAADAASDEITDEEFESLLDDMHGKGKAPQNALPESNITDNKKTQAQAVKASVPPEAAENATGATDVRPKPASKTFPAQKTIQSETTVRVDTSRLDEIMNLVGELVLARNRLNTLKESFEDDRVHEAIANLDVVTGDLQAAVMKTRMQPVKKVFGRFPRVVRDLARSLEKEVSLEMVGEDTDLDKNLVEALADPLVHLVRNSVDHGIELPDVREAAHKPREGTVILAAQQEGDHILLSITDDGAGINPEVLRDKAIEKGLMDSDGASRLDDKGCFELIFLPGMTTKQEITDVSGRGVGMDVVKTKITQLNGQIEIESAPGKGTCLKIKVPLTLAILPTLMVRLGSRKFALPLSNVSEIFELSSKKTSVIDSREVVLNRGKAPPIFYLRKWLLNGSEPREPAGDDPQVIMVQVANTQVGLVVDQVIGQEEVVIKPLGALLHGLPGMAGSTITGDGNIAIILDVQGLLQTYA
ncbi:MAG: chemotaxis protein CheA, partial [Gammaproteobacteria bacterium]|nr:chemotaxis protein CheA [Gammaproteobacteria bacterium]